MSSAATSAVQKSAFRKFWDAPAGPKTIHFWAPAMKWVNKQSIQSKQQNKYLFNI